MQKNYIAFFILAAIILISLVVVLYKSPSLSPSLDKDVGSEDIRLYAGFLSFPLVFASPMGAVTTALTSTLGGEMCGVPECKTFTSSKFRIRDPFSHGALWWKNLMERPDVKAEIERWLGEIENWVSSYQCPEGCTKSEGRPGVTFHMEPVESTGAICANAGKTMKIHISEESQAVGFGRCTMATANAGRKIQEKLVKEISSFCGENCGGAIVVKNASSISQDLGFQRGCKVTLEADVEITCAAVSSSNEYNIWAEISTCVSCSKPNKAAVGAEE